MTQIIHEVWIPAAVKYEIPLDMFRRLNPKLMERYQPFFAEQMKQRRQEMSDQGWTNGLYVGRAIANCFPKGKKYPDEPLVLWSDGVADEFAEPFTDADRFAGFVSMFNKRFEQ